MPDQLRRARGLRHSSGHEADWPAAEDKHHILRRDACTLQHPVRRHRRRFAIGSFDKTQIIRGAVQQPGWHFDELGESAIHKVTRRAFGDARKSIPGEALAAAPTSMGVLFRHHTVTGSPTGDAAAHLGNLPRKFVADHYRRRI